MRFWLVMIGALVVFGFCGLTLWAACAMSGRGNDSDA